MLSAADRALGEQIDVVVATPRADAPEAVALRRAASGPYAPDLVLATLVPGAEHAAWPLFVGKDAADGDGLCLPGVRLPRADVRPAPPRDPGGRARRSQPGRKLSRTLRLVLSRFGSTSAIDCHVPSARRPPTTGTVTDGGMSSGST